MEAKKLTRFNGEVVDATSPVIISASRSTDIPGFYAEWFMDKIRKGYCVWNNPYNNKPMYISFSDTRAFVFWTKNPKPILPYLKELDERRYNYYFQYTLNDYVSEGYEPNVPALEERIDTFKQLSKMIGADRVIWRFDPLILTEELTPRKLVSKIYHIGENLIGCTNKLVFSFADIATYAKVKNNLAKEGIKAIEWSEGTMNEMAEEIKKLKEYWATKHGWNIEVATCAEKIDLDKYGIQHNKCIDPSLLEKLFGEDKKLLYFCRTGKIWDGVSAIPEQKDVKDKGQRKLCGCMVSKDIGSYGTCKHFCKYCYANPEPVEVIRRLENYNINNESIV